MKKTFKSNSYSQKLKLLAIFVIMLAANSKINAKTERNYSISKEFTLTQSPTPATPSYILEIKNDIQISPTEYTFDIYIKNTSTNPLWLISWEMQGFQAGIKVNSDIVNGGVITPTIVSGFSDLLVSNQQTNANLSMQGFTSGIPNANYGLKMTAKAASLGSGTQILTSEMCICRIKLSNTVPFSINSHPDLSWSFSLIPWQTKVSAFLPAATDITNQPDHINNNLANPALNPQLNTPAIPLLSTNIITLNSSLYACGSVNPDISGNTITILNGGYVFPDTALVGNCTDIEYLWEYSYDNLNWISIGTFNNAAINFTGLTITQNTYLHRLSRISCSEPVNNITQNISNSIFLTVYPSLSVSIESQANVSCFNGTNGYGTVLVNGGTPSYSYIWSNTLPVKTTASVSGLSAGLYVVTTTDGNGCTATTSIEITQPLQIIPTAVLSSPISCFEGTALVTVSATGGSLPYSSGVGSFNVAAGSQTFIVTDNNGCTAEATINITQPSRLTVTISTLTNISCNNANDGIISVTSGGGTGNHTYAWFKDGFPYGSNTSGITGLAVGNYAVIVTDENNCTATTSISITQPDILIFSLTSRSNLTCFENATGSFQVIPTGGTPTYSYSWLKDNISYAGTTNSITGLSIGNYTVVVKDANNCTLSYSANITQPSALQSVGIVTNSTCGLSNNGSINLSTNGGTFPYSYLWSNSATTEDIINLASANYSVTVTDFNGCNITKGFDVNSYDCQPTTMNDFGFVDVNSVLNGSVQNNDTPSGDGSNVWSLIGINGGALNGTVNMDINGNYTYIPNPGYSGIDVFSYNLCDVDNDCSTASVSITVDSLNVFCLMPKVLLQGPYDSNNHLMWDSLRVHNLIPVTEPYSSFPYNQNFTHTGGGGNETISNPIAIFGVTGSNAIVDWVFIELRDKNNNKLVKHTRSALLQRDGDIVDVDGVSPICFQGLNDNQFYIVIRHRNHLGVMTANAKILTTQGTEVDFRNNLEPEFNFGTTHPVAGNSFNFTGLSQFTTMDGKRALWNGNANNDHKVKYEAPNDDQSIPLMNVFLNNGNSSFQSGFDFAIGYYSGDVDLNGKAKYEAPNDDQSIILLQVLIYPLNSSYQSAFDFMYEQIPF